MSMRRFIFVSRHEATAEQISLAQKQDIELVQFGDLDAFQVKLADIERLLTEGRYRGAIVVHPLLAMKFAMLTSVGIFENGSRPGIDGTPMFFATDLVILPPASSWQEMREPCDCCSVVGGYCGGSSHISCGEFRNTLPIPYSEVIGVD